MRLRNRRILIPLTLLTVAWLSSHLYADSTDREKTLTQAYVTVVKAEQSVRDGEKKKAVDGYAAALHMFRQLLADHPNWRSTVVREQIPHCINEIKALLEDEELSKQYSAKFRESLKLSSPARPASRPRASTAARVSSKKDVMSQVEEELLSINAKLRSRLMSLEMTTDELRREVADSPKLKAAERRCEELRKENAVLTDENKMMQDKVNDLDRRIRVLSKIQQDGATSKKEESELRERLKTVEAQYKQLLDEKMKMDVERAGVKASGTEEASDDVEALKAELATSKEERESLVRRNAVLQAQLDDAAAGGVRRGRPKKGAPVEAANFIRRGELGDARDSVTGGLARSPDDRKLRLILGILYCKEGNFEAAVRTLKKLVADEKEDVDIEAHLALGGAYLALGNYENAKMELEMVIAFAPDMSEGHFNLAQVLLANDPPDVEGARKSYVTALKRGAKADPKFEEHLSMLLKKADGERRRR